MQTVAVGDGCQHGLLGYNCGPSGGAADGARGGGGEDGQGRGRPRTAVQTDFIRLKNNRKKDCPRPGFTLPLESKQGDTLLSGQLQTRRNHLQGEFYSVSNFINTELPAKYLFLFLIWLGHLHPSPQREGLFIPQNPK